MWGPGERWPASLSYLLLLPGEGAWVKWLIIILPIKWTIFHFRRGRAPKRPARLAERGIALGRPNFWEFTSPPGRSEPSIGVRRARKTILTRSAPRSVRAARSNDGPRHNASITLIDSYALLIIDGMKHFTIVEPLIMKYINNERLENLSWLIDEPR